MIDSLDVRFGPLDGALWARQMAVAAEALRPPVRRAASASSPDAVLQG